jgi:(S)-ureidoglycine aminohydrolase
LLPLILSKNRAVVTNFYSLLPAEGILESKLPNFVGAKAYIHVSPDIGNARFVQMVLKMDSGGRTRVAIDDGLEHFIYVLEGSVSIEVNKIKDRLIPGGYAYIPVGSPFNLLDAVGNTSLVWIKRRYEQIHVPAPGPKISHQNSKPEIPDEKAPGSFDQYLLDEEDLAFDMSMKIIILEPGAHFECVETHIMEHGLYMLAGKGIYYLAGDTHEVQAGDFIWMAPYCPQYYVCIGQERSAYLLYKNINRDPHV